MRRVRAPDRLRRRPPTVRYSAPCPASTSPAIAPTVSSIGVVRVDAVLVVEVDVIDAEPLQARVARAAHVLGLAVDAAVARAVRVAHDAELRGEDDLVAAIADRPADELLVRERAVDVGGVEEVDAELERAMDRRDRLGLVVGP